MKRLVFVLCGKQGEWSARDVFIRGVFDSEDAARDALASLQHKANALVAREPYKEKKNYFIVKTTWNSCDVADVLMEFET